MPTPRSSGPALHHPFTAFRGTRGEVRVERSSSPYWSRSEKYLGQPFLSWVTAEPERSAQFSRAMAEVTSSLRTGMFDGYRLAPGRCP
ncbi:MAG: hypothetical protein ACRDQ0_05890, partial [Pseudonocardia sp.]